MRSYVIVSMQGRNYIKEKTFEIKNIKPKDLIVEFHRVVILEQDSEI